MQDVPGQTSSFLGGVAKKAIVAVLALGVSACGGSERLWQGEEVLVEARQEVLERDVYNVSDDHREPKNRFDALERLYVELVHQLREQSGKMALLEAQLGAVENDPEAAEMLSKVRGDVSVIREQMKKLENRVFSVEMTDQSPVATNSMAVPNTATAQVGTTDASVTSSPEPSVPVNNNAAPKQTFFGVHLASYRSQEQVDSGWSGLMQAFGGELEGLTPLIYTQSQEGIGTFLRLIAGPLINEQEATSLCTRIKETVADQYCRVSEYQGEPVS